MHTMDQNFSRADESDDSLFYATDRFVNHLDDTALATVQKIIGTLVIEDQPKILDLMASFDSHLPEDLKPGRVEALGLNANEMAANPAVDRYVIQDINRNPDLPYPTATFDAVICTVSVDYLVRPVAVFNEVARVLKPGGLFLVIFSNRWFEEKVTEAWKDCNEAERVWNVKSWLGDTEAFDQPQVFVSKGRSRPGHDKYAELGIPSDPVYAVYADKAGGDPYRPARPVVHEPVDRPEAAVIAERSARVKETLRCPYCDQRMKKWEVPQTPFTEWDNEYMYVCFNDQCAYMVGGWEEMGRQGNYGVSYRMMYNPDNDCLMPVAVPSIYTMRDGIVEE